MGAGLHTNCVSIGAGLHTNCVSNVSMGAGHHTSCVSMGAGHLCKVSIITLATPLPSLIRIYLPAGLVPENIVVSAEVEEAGSLVQVSVSGCCVRAEILFHYSVYIRSRYFLAAAARCNV